MDALFGGGRDLIKRIQKFKARKVQRQILTPDHCVLLLSTPMSNFSANSGFRSNISSSGSDIGFNFDETPSILNYNSNTLTRMPKAPSHFDPGPPENLLYQPHRNTHQFQPQPQYNSNTATTTNSGPSLAELLRYPAVQQLYNDLTEANRCVTQALKAQGQLQQEILRLSSIIRSDAASQYTGPGYK